MKIKILNSCIVEGRDRNKDDVVDVSDASGKTLINFKLAETTDEDLTPDADPATSADGDAGSKKKR